MSDTVPFTEIDIKKYLDDRIKYWRNERDIAIRMGVVYSREMAINYIDAFQSVRISLFGESLSRQG